MHCDDAQFFLRFRRPGSAELDADVAAGLDRHLAGCTRCSAASRSDSAFDAAVAAAMTAVLVPAGMRDRLVARVSEQRGAALRHRAYRVGALAASFLLAVGLTIGAFTAARPAPDTYDLTTRGDALAGVLRTDGMRVAAQNDLPTDPLVAEANQRAVSAWLRAEGLPPTLPEPFDFGLLLSYHWESVQGRKVPVVFFRERSGAGFAKVYVFDSLGFDLKSVPGAQSSYCLARPYPGPIPGVTFVVVFTGQSLAPFLQGRVGEFASA